jgi:hypothetical protein
LLSYYRDEQWKWTFEQRNKPELRHHEEFLEDVESFLVEFAPELETRGQPKE